MNKEKKERNLKNSEFRDNEDLPVIDHLDRITKGQELSMLEVGSGLCRFVKKVRELYPSINISCVEINSDLAKIAQNEGCVVYNTSFLDNTLPSNTFDIVHCSHVIEHFKYPEIIKVIDELLRVTKIEGYLVIRSPLMWKHFYDDIDHVRPYPPECILNYLYNPQQQVVGENNVEVVRIWYRTSPLEFEPIDRSNWLYGITPIRLFYNKHVLSRRNRLYKKLWNKFRWPSTKPNGYVMILKKTK
jgi:hypothetical protein